MVKKTQKFDRRTRKEDRRDLKNMPKVPFVDNNGEIVRLDRRRAPDLRLNNIQVEWDITQDNDVARDAEQLDSPKDVEDQSK